MRGVSPPDLKVNAEAARECGVSLEAVHAYLKKREVPLFLDDIQADGKRAARIVANMLQFSRRSEAIKEPALVHEVIDRTLELAANDYDLKKRFDFRHIELVREYEPDLPAVPLVAQEIEQVLLNLMRNAAQAMVGAATEQPQLTLRVRRDGQWLQLEVQDNGPGISDAIRKRIFEPFFTTKTVGQGTGLGLSVSYMIIVNNHGGTLEVESVPGEGTTFVIRLPIEARSHDGTEDPGTVGRRRRRGCGVVWLPFSRTRVSMSARRLAARMPWNCSPRTNLTSGSSTCACRGSMAIP